MSPVSRLGEDRHQEERDQAESLHGNFCPKVVRNFGIQYISLSNTVLCCVYINAQAEWHLIEATTT